MNRRKPDFKALDKVSEPQQNPDVISGIPLAQGFLEASAMGLGKRPNQAIALTRAQRYLVSAQQSLVMGLGIVAGLQLTGEELSILNWVGDAGLKIDPETAARIIQDTVDAAAEKGIALPADSITPERAAILLSLPKDVTLASYYIGIMTEVADEEAAKRAATMPRPAIGMALPPPPHRSG